MEDDATLLESAPVSRGVPIGKASSGGQQSHLGAFFSRNIHESLMLRYHYLWIRLGVSIAEAKPLDLADGLGDLKVSTSLAQIHIHAKRPVRLQFSLEDEFCVV